MTVSGKVNPALGSVSTDLVMKFGDVLVVVKSAVPDDHESRRRNRFKHLLERCDGKVGPLPPRQASSCRDHKIIFLPALASPDGSPLRTRYGLDRSKVHAIQNRDDHALWDPGAKEALRDKVGVRNSNTHRAADFPYNQLDRRSRHERWRNHVFHFGDGDGWKAPDNQRARAVVMQDASGSPLVIA